jgi:hypothetical protein
MTHLSASAFYWIAIIVFVAWYSRRSRADAARRKEQLGNNPDDYSRAGQPSDTAPYVVFAIIFAATLALIAWQQHHR